MADRGPECAFPMGRDDTSFLWAPQSLPFSITARTTMLSLWVLLIVCPLAGPLENVE